MDFLFSIANLFVVYSSEFFQANLECAIASGKAVSKKPKKKPEPVDIIDIEVFIADQEIINEEVLDDVEEVTARPGQHEKVAEFEVLIADPDIYNEEVLDDVEEVIARSEQHEKVIE